jgi:hypothetical protein
MADERWLIVGLGNPGPGYAGNRHNAGYLVADEIASRIGGRFKPGKYRSSIAEGRLDGTPVTVAKPLTYMNESGGPVAGLRGYYHLDPDHIVAVHDELDLPFGTIRLKLGGGDNGHNGLRSVTSALGTRDYYRAPSRPDGSGRVRAARFQRRRAQGTAVPGRPECGRRASPAQHRPGRGPECLSRRVPGYGPS